MRAGAARKTPRRGDLLKSRRVSSEVEVEKVMVELVMVDPTVELSTDDGGENPVLPSAMAGREGEKKGKVLSTRSECYG